MTTTADVLIVGAGIAGLSLAQALSANCSVLVADMEREVATHSSSRSARQMQPSYGPDVIRRLTDESINLVRSWEAAGLGVLSPRKLLWVASRNSQSNLDDLLHAVNDLREISPKGARKLLPLLGEEVVGRAALDENAYEVDVARLVAFYRHGAQTNGTAILTASPVRSAERRGEGWTILCGETIVSTRLVVNAAGAWADAVADIFGASSVGLRSYRRTVAIVSTESVVDPKWPMMSSIDGDFYIRPFGDRELLISPSDEIPDEPGDARPRAADVRTATNLLRVYTNVRGVDVRRTWAGLRSFAPDHLPVVGPDPAVEGLWWLAGQGGYGIQTSPALARAVAADILNGTPSEPGSSVPLELAPARFVEGGFR